MSRKFIMAAALGAATLYGGSVAAGDYPPDTPSESTVVSSSQSGIQRPSDPIATSTAQLPSTGSDSGAMIKIAGGAVVAGAGLMVVAKRRRRLAPS